jgi:hypothetical protein
VCYLLEHVLNNAGLLPAGAGKNLALQAENVTARYGVLTVRTIQRT